jgi:DegV family protein with EDD domain
MTGVRILTDTVSCIPEDLRAKYDIALIPAANIHINGTSYVDGVDLTAEDAYRQIQNDPDSFVTSALTPAVVTEAYEKLGRETDAIVFVTISSALTALNKTAGMAAAEYMEKHPEKTIRVVDSLACAGMEGLVALAAAKAAAAGKNIDAVAEYAEKTRKQTGGLMMLDTLRYVYRTGRMSKTASRMLSMFSIRPINRITDEGTLEMEDRARKKSEGLEKLLKLIGDKVQGTPHHFLLSHAASPDTAESMREELTKRFSCLDILVSDYSPVMGYGSGPGAIFVGYQPEIPFE